MEINSNLFDKGRQNWITSTPNSHQKRPGGEPGAEFLFKQFIFHSLKPEPRT